MEWRAWIAKAKELTRRPHFRDFICCADFRAATYVRSKKVIVAFSCILKLYFLVSFFFEPFKTKRKADDICLLQD